MKGGSDGVSVSKAISSVIVPRATQGRSKHPRATEMYLIRDIVIFEVLAWWSKV